MTPLRRLTLLAIAPLFFPSARRQLQLRRHFAPAYHAIAKHLMAGPH